MNPEHIKTQLRALIAANPELQDDEILKLDTIEGATEVKELLEILVSQIAASNAMADGIKLYENTFRARRERFERRAESIRGLIFSVMQAAELKKFPLPMATLTVSNGQQRVIITDETAIPERFMKIEQTPRKNDIKSAIAQGETVPGATLSNAEPVLTIRMS